MYRERKEQQDTYFDMMLDYNSTNAAIEVNILGNKRTDNQEKSISDQAKNILGDTAEEKCDLTETVVKRRKIVSDKEINDYLEKPMKIPHDFEYIKPRADQV